MSTYVSMLIWTGDLQPRPADVRTAVRRSRDRLHGRGLRSLAFLPDEGECAAVMVSCASDEESVAEMAYSILPRTTLRIDSMLFDDGPTGESHGEGAVVLPPPPRDELGDVLDEVAA